MAEISVTQFAEELHMPVNALLEQLGKAGVNKNGATDRLNEADKARLLEFLRTQHGTGEQKSKITLTRKQTSEIKATDSSGRARTVQVEVRKKRVFVKRDESAEAGTSVEAAKAEPQKVEVEVKPIAVEAPVVAKVEAPVEAVKVEEKAPPVI